MLNYIPLVTQGLLMKQPRALTPLFLTEMWERFGFYVTQSLLILYITNVLNFSDSRAYMILGEFTALVYIAPLAGGFFADRVLGPRYAIFLGAIFLGLGYFFLGFAGQKLLFLSLSILVVGNGLLKPNISSFLGQFYYENDPRRDAGFTLFYIGINLGGLLALGSAGFIQEKLGWGAAFLSAGVGMLIATVTFCFGFKKYENRGLPIPPDQIRPSFLRMTRHKLSIIFLILLTILIAYLLLSSTGIANLLQLVLGISILVTLLFVSSRFEKRIRNKFLVLIILILASIVFWGILFQAFASVNLFTQRVVDRHIVGLLIPSPAFISLETIFIILLGPFLAALWQRLHIKKTRSHARRKIFFCYVFSGNCHDPFGFSRPLDRNQRTYSSYLGCTFLSFSHAGRDVAFPHWIIDGHGIVSSSFNWFNDGHLVHGARVRRPIIWFFS